MERGRTDAAALSAAGRALRNSRAFAPRGKNQKSFHGRQDHQRGRGCDCQRAGHGLLPCHRSGGWSSRGKLFRLSKMTSALKKFWPETFRYAKKFSPFYREQFRGIKGVPRLEDLPTVDKKVLSERNLDFLCV